MSRERSGGDLRLVLRVISLARPYVPLIIAFFLISLLATPITLLGPMPLKIVADALVGNKAVPGVLAPITPDFAQTSTSRLILLAAVLLVLVTALKHAQDLARTLLNTFIGERLVFSLRSKLFSRVQRLSLSYHDTHGTTDATYRIQYDAAAIQNLALEGLIPFFTSSLTFVSMLYVIILIDWQLGLIAVVAAPIMFALTQAYRQRLRDRARHVKRVESSAMSVIQEALSSLRVVKVFAQEDREHDRYSERASEALNARVSLSATEGFFGLLIGLVTASMTALILYIGALHVESGAITMGELLLVMGYLSQLYDPLKSASKRVGKMQSSLAGAERAFALLDQDPDVPESPNARPLRRAEGYIELQNVAFGYDAGLPVLRNLSLTVNPGQRVGIYGATGAGKTTLVSLLMRLYDTDDGAVLLDHLNVRDYKVADLRSQFSVVLQEPVLFSTTIAENIAYARPEASRQEIEQAARLAAIHDFIVGLPDGYQTVVGERGMRLSGGERQRVAMARAFLKDAPILILDEPTSSVDGRTEQSIVAAMGQLMKGRTVIMIAHRLSTLESCDFWLEMEPGGTCQVRYSPPGQSRSGRRPVPLSVASVPKPARDRTRKHRHKGSDRREAALGAWEGMTGERLSMERAEALQERPKAFVYRLLPSGDRPYNVIAKGRMPGRLKEERRLYETILPKLPVRTPKYLGHSEHAETGTEWLFVEDAGGVLYSRDLHNVVAAFWLAELHTSAEEIRQPVDLPTTDFLDHLKAARRNVVESFGNPVLTPDDQEFLDDLVRLLDVIEGTWPAYVGLSRQLPDTLSHGDFVAKNLRIRQSPDGSQELLAFDWEMASWGSPAADLAGINLYAYWKAASQKWPFLNLEQLERIAAVGRLFRYLAATRWESQSLPYEYLEKHLAKLRLFDERMREVLCSLESKT